MNAVICELCQKRCSVLSIAAHLALAHGVRPKVEAWPDGEPVVIDWTALEEEQ